MDLTVYQMKTIDFSRFMQAFMRELVLKQWTGNYTTALYNQLIFHQAKKRTFSGSICCFLLFCKLNIFAFFITKQAIYKRSPWAVGKH